MFLTTETKKCLENLTHEYLRYCLLSDELEVSIIKSIHVKILYLGYH